MYINVRLSDLNLENQIHQVFQMPALLITLNPYQGLKLEASITQILHLAVETAATQTKPAYAGYKTLAFQLVRVGGLGLYSPRIPF